MKIAKLTVALLLSLGSTLSQAAVFTENFDGFTADQINWNPAGANGWVVGPTANDTVDLIGQGGDFDLLLGNGRYVDYYGRQRYQLYSGHGGMSACLICRRDGRRFYRLTSGMRATR